MEKSEYFRNLLRGAMERRGRFIKTEIKETQPDFGDFRTQPTIHRLEKNRRIFKTIKLLIDSE